MENLNKQLIVAAKDVLALHDNEVFVADPWNDSMEDLRQAIAAAEQAQSSNCIAQGRREQMLELANEITASASPDEDELLEVAYSIARYLKLDWPSAYDVDYAFKRIDEALTGMAITVEEEQTFEHLRAMLAPAQKGGT